MAFSPPVVGCLIKKGLQKGGSRAPQDPPLATPLDMSHELNYFQIAVTLMISLFQNLQAICLR